MSDTTTEEKTITFEVGQDAPDFNLPTDSGANASLAELKGKKIVLYFYPKDDTPGCTIEAKEFRDNIDAFAAANTTIIGVSKDSVKSHDKFKEKHCLPFALASDEEGDVCERYGVWIEKAMYGKKYMGIQRATFLIGEDGKFLKIWPKVSVTGHVDEVLAAAQN